MDAELYDEWQRNKTRPAYVREHRDELTDHLSEGVVEDVPDPDASLFEYRQFLNTHMGTVTRQLNPANGETPTTEDTETEA